VPAQPDIIDSQNSLITSKLKLLSIYKPNTGIQVRQETVETLLKKYKKVKPIEARSHWQEQYTKSSTQCTHIYRQGHCSFNKATTLQLLRYNYQHPYQRYDCSCEIGLRTRKFHILAGSVLTVWTRVENVVCNIIGCSTYRLQIIRVKTNDNQKIVGCVIPLHCVQQVDALLNSISRKTFIKNHNTVYNDTSIEQQNFNFSLPPPTCISPKITPTITTIKKFDINNNSNIKLTLPTATTSKIINSSSTTTNILLNQNQNSFDVFT
jgi:hypothetical protein